MYYIVYTLVYANSGLFMVYNDMNVYIFNVYIFTTTYILRIITVITVTVIYTY